MRSAALVRGQVRSSAAAPSQLPALTGHHCSSILNARSITTYIGIYNATSVPYGANGTLAIAANSTKTNIEVSNW